MHFLQKCPFQPQKFIRSIHYFVIAHDFPNNLHQRKLYRQAHLERAKAAKESGLILLGGATLSETNAEMNGSVLLFDAPSKEHVESYLTADPYVVGKVWKSWTITPFKCAAVSGKLMDLL
jgi:uncharacterized protein